MFPPQRVSVPRAVGTDPHLGQIRSARSLSPPAQQPARCYQTFSASWCGGGALGAVWGPSAILAARTACIAHLSATRA